MSLRYAKLHLRPSAFQRLFGLLPGQFDVIVQKLRPAWEKALKSSYKRPGRDYKLDLEDMALMLILYYRSYVTQMFIGFLFGIDDSRVCRIIRKLEPVLAKVMAIKKERHLSREELESLIIDATEQPCERPQKKQKAHYSGKKKTHTLKNEIRITRNRRIVSISKTAPGAVHDFALCKQERPPGKDTRIFADSGYQGLDKIHTATEIPYKKSKNKPLDPDEKEYNRALSRIRVRVENVFCQIKTFKILSQRYRNKRKRHHLKFNIVAGIVNLKNGFAPA